MNTVESSKPNKINNKIKILGFNLRGTQPIVKSYCNKQLINQTDIPRVSWFLRPEPGGLPLAFFEVDDGEEGDWNPE